MLSNTASPMKRPSMPIPQSMQKLIAKLQCPKKNERKSLRSLPLRLNHGSHSSKKSKIHDKFPNTVEHQDNEVSSMSTNLTNPADGREKNDKEADPPEDLFVTNKEKTFTYPQIDSSDKSDDGSNVLNSTGDSFSAFKTDGKPNCLDLPEPVMQSKSDLKSAFKIKNADRDNIPKKWVTFNDILQDTKRGSFVDELYNEDDEPVDSHQLLSECSSENNESGLANYEDHHQPKPDVDDTHQLVLNAIQQVRQINDMITKANEEINLLPFTNRGVGDTQ